MEATQELDWDDVPSHSNEEDKSTEVPVEGEQKKRPALKTEGVAVIHSSEGDIKVILNSKEAKSLCETFCSLVTQGLYNNSKFHRVLPGFYIQGGKIDKSKRPDLKQNSSIPPSLVPGLSTLSFNRKGVVGITKDSEIVISLDVCNALDTKYYIFGKVSEETIDVVNKIATLETDTNGRPLFGGLINSISLLSNPFEKKTKKQKKVSFDHAEPSEFKTPNNSPVKETPTTPLISFSPVKKQVMIRGATQILDEQQALKPFFSFDDSELSRPSMDRGRSLPNIQKLVQNVRPRMAKRLVIIRHGQSEQNAALDLLDPDIKTTSSIRDADIKLTEMGKWQAVETGKYLATTDKFDICFCSPYDRAIQTCECILSQLPYKLKMYKDNWLREKEFGRLHGLDAKSVKERFPLEYEMRQRDGTYWYKFPGGENYPDVEMRVHAFLEKINRDYAGRSVLVITHQVPYKMFRALFQYLDEKGVLSLPPTPNCGIQEWMLDRLKSPEGRMRLKMYDYVAYNMENAPKNTAPLTRKRSRTMANS